MFNLGFFSFASNPGVRLGGAEVEDPDELINSAISIAKDADAVIAVVGLNADWETEGYDRTTLALPGRTDEMVQKVIAANPRTVVVTQAVSDRRLICVVADDLNRDPLSLCLGSTKFLPSFILGIWVMLLVMLLPTLSLGNTIHLESFR